MIAVLLIMDYIRASGINQLYTCTCTGVPEKFIMERSGHINICGVRSYERTTDAQKMKISQILTTATSTETASCEMRFHLVKLT